MSRSRAAVSALFFVNGFVVASWIPYIPMLKSRHAIGDGQLGFTLLAMVVGGVLGLPLAGWLVGRCGSRLVAVTAALGLSVMLPAPVLSPSLALASLALLGFGTFNGLLDVSMNAQAVDVERRGGRPIMSSFHALFSLGGLVGVSVAGLAMFEHVPPVAHVVIVSVSMVTVVVLGASSLVVPAGVASTGSVFARPPRKLLGLGLLALCGLLLAEGAMARLAAVATLGYFGWLAGPPIIGMLSEALGLSGALGIVSAACAFVAIRANVASDTARDATAMDRRV